MSEKQIYTVKDIAKAAVELNKSGLSSIKVNSKLAGEALKKVFCEATLAVPEDKEDKLSEYVINVFNFITESSAEEVKEDEPKEEEVIQPEEEKVVELKKVKEKKTTSKDKKEKKSKEKKIGVIATVVELLKKKYWTKEDLLKELVIKFPERKEDSMKGSITTLIPSELTKKRGFKLDKKNNTWKIID